MTTPQSGAQTQTDGTTNALYGGSTNPLAGIPNMSTANLPPSSGFRFVNDQLNPTTSSLETDAETTEKLASRTGGISVYYPLAIRDVGKAHDQTRDQDVETGKVAGEVLKSFRSAAIAAHDNYRKAEEGSEYKPPGGIVPTGLSNLGGLGGLGNLGGLGGGPSLPNTDLTGSGLNTSGLDRQDLQGPKMPEFDDSHLKNPNRPNPDLKYPDLKYPDPNNPDYRPPDFKNPNLNSPSLDNPSLRTPNLNTADLKTPELNTPDPGSTGLANYDPSNLQTPNLQTPNVRTPEIPTTYTGDPSTYGRAGTGTGTGTGMGTGPGLGGATAAGLSARGVNGANGMPMMPMMPPMGGGGQTEDKERDKDTYELREDESVWMDPDGIAPPTLTHEA
ncbi:hypothetical protein ACFXJ8_00860 [Nonomuraea sp. NPDC059194]|uniref:hypothetical protein n=1 Tax=Nonomuraea sp. NPDC059194 TaxID=3346764 RepID=UPI00367528DC